MQEYWRWRRLTLPHHLQCSTISARKLNCRVRDGTGCTLAALATNKIFAGPSLFSIISTYSEVTRAHVVPSSKRLAFFSTYSRFSYKKTGSKSPASPYHARCKKPSTISTGSLHTSLRLHVPPIKLVVFQRSSSFSKMGNLVLRSASHLDAFSGYPIRSSLPGYAAGATTGTRALRPPRSSRTRGSSSQIPYAHSG